MKEQKEKRYTSDAIDVTYIPRRCIHAKECVHGMGSVFDVSKRPWIQPDQTDDADQLAEVVLRCPTGALHFERHDGGANETPDETNRIELVENGPLYVRGDLALDHGQGVYRETRMALCRCGDSKNKPFCDNSHIEEGFSADATPPAAPTEVLGAASTGTPLTLKPIPNGPVLFNGPAEFAAQGGETVDRRDKGALCRCGASSNKPYCDGTHSKIGFSTEETA